MSKRYNEEELITFLCEAKRRTYAGSGNESLSTRPNSHDLRYADGDLLYIDTYLGGEIFAGEEALWINEIPYWSMNYLGRITADGFSGDFLKEALLNVPMEYPFRGPKHFKQGDYDYILHYEGEFKWFIGQEEILYKGKKVYECLFHGGLIK